MEPVISIVLGEELTRQVRLAWPEDYSEEYDLLDGGWEEIDLPCFAARLDLSEVFEGAPASLIFISRCIYDGNGPSTREELFLTVGCVWYAVKGIRFDGERTVFTLITEAVE